MNWSKRIQQDLAEQNAKSLWRKRLELSSGQSELISLAGQSQPLINFCSNDYLALAQDGSQALSQAALKWGSGSGASHLVCGHSSAHQQLEQALADAVGYDRALLFSNGYMANVALQQALLKKGDLVLHDKLNHASLIDGGLLATSTYRQAGAAKFSRYLHSDINSLQQKLNKPIDGQTLVMTDAVFSMDGDIAPLAQIAETCQSQHALLMIDDAHGFGVLGQQGRGSANHFDLSPQQVPIYMATLGKALGGYGAFVAASEEIIEYLIQFARPYIYTTALPPALAEAMQHNLDLLLNDNRQQLLTNNIQLFKQLSARYQLPLLDSQTAIQPIIIGDEAKTLQASQALKEQGMLVAAIRPPTVAAGTARLRITLTAKHSSSDIERLVKNLADILAELGSDNV